MLCTAVGNHRAEFISLLSVIWPDVDKEMLITAALIIRDGALKWLKTQSFCSRIVRGESCRLSSLSHWLMSCVRCHFYIALTVIEKLGVWVRPVLEVSASLSLSDPSSFDSWSWKQLVAIRKCWWNLCGGGSGVSEDVTVTYHCQKA